MTVNVAGGLLRVAVLAVCILLPPVTEIIVEWMQSRRGKAAIRERVSLRHVVDEVCRRLREPVLAPIVARICVFLCFTFNLMALYMLALQMNLLPALFLQSFSALALLVGETSMNPLAQQKIASRRLRDFLIQQPILLAVAVGFFFATGSFTVSDSAMQPKILLAEAPLLFFAVLGIAYFTAKDNSSILLLQPESTEANSLGGIIAAAKSLAEVYRLSFLLLLAGLLVGYGPGYAAVAAIALYALIIRFGPVLQSLLRRNRVELNWTYVFFAVGLNLTWLYIKYC